MARGGLGRRRPWRRLLLLLLTAAALARACPGRTRLAPAAGARGQLGTGPGATYAEAATCEWLITAPPGHAVRLDFDVSATE